MNNKIQLLSLWDRKDLYNQKYLSKQSKFKWLKLSWPKWKTYWRKKTSRWIKRKAKLEHSLFQVNKNYIWKNEVLANLELRAKKREKDLFKSLANSKQV